MTVHGIIEDSTLKHVTCVKRGKIRVPRVMTGFGLKLIG